MERRVQEVERSAQEMSLEWKRQMDELRKLLLKRRRRERSRSPRRCHRSRSYSDGGEARSDETRKAKATKLEIRRSWCDEWIHSHGYCGDRREVVLTEIDDTATEETLQICKALETSRTEAVKNAKDREDPMKQVTDPKERELHQRPEPLKRGACTAKQTTSPTETESATRTVVRVTPTPVKTVGQATLKVETGAQEKGESSNDWVSYNRVPQTLLVPIPPPKPPYYGGRRVVGRISSEVVSMMVENEAEVKMGRRLPPPKPPDRNLKAVEEEMRREENLTESAVHEVEIQMMEKGEKVVEASQRCKVGASTLMLSEKEVRIAVVKWRPPPKPPNRVTQAVAEELEDTAENQTKEGMKSECQDRGVYSAAPIPSAAAAVAVRMETHATSATNTREKGAEVSRQGKENGWERRKQRRLGLPSTIMGLAQQKRG